LGPGDHAPRGRDETDSVETPHLALRNTAPLAAEPEPTNPPDRPQLGASWATWLRYVPFGGILGVLASVAIVWKLPRYVPEGWKPETFVGVGLAVGIAVSRICNWLFGWLFGWFFEPILRHMRAAWEARIQVRKLERYRKSGFIDEEELKKLAAKIAKSDVTGAVPPGTRWGGGMFGGVGGGMFGRWGGFRRPWF